MIIYFKTLRELYTAEGARYAFEVIVKEAISSEFGSIRSVSPHPGDSGIECYIGSLNGKSTVFQCKYFPDQILDKQKEQIRDSFKTVAENQDLKCEKWILCIPKDMTFEENKWFDRWKAAQPISIDVFDESYLRSLLTKHPEIADRYFQQTDVSLLKTIVGTLSAIKADLELRIQSKRKPSLVVGILNSDHVLECPNVNISKFCNPSDFVDPIHSVEQVDVEALVGALRNDFRTKLISVSIEDLARDIVDHYSQKCAAYEKAEAIWRESVARENNRSILIFGVKNLGNLPATNVRVNLTFPPSVKVEVIEDKKEFPLPSSVAPPKPSIQKIINAKLDRRGNLPDFPHLPYHFHMEPPILPSFPLPNAFRFLIEYDGNHHAYFHLARVAHAGGIDHHLGFVVLESLLSREHVIKYRIISDEMNEHSEGAINLIPSAEATQRKFFDPFAD